MDRPLLSPSHEETRSRAIDTSSATPLVQDSGEGRGEAGDGGV